MLDRFLSRRRIVSTTVLRGAERALTPAPSIPPRPPPIIMERFVTWLPTALAPFGLGPGPGPVDDPTDPLIPPIEVDPNLVSPGVAGFIAIAAVTIVVILLLVDMMRRMRRVRYRGEIRERLAAEQAEQDASAAPGAAAGGSAAEGRVDGDEQDPRPVA